MNDAPAKLVVLTGKLEGREIELPRSVIIGRAPGLKIRLADSKVSREHAKIYRQGADFYVVDLNSRNGTLVNDAKVTKRILRDRDEVLIGNTRFRFSRPPAAEKTPTRIEVPKEPAFKEVIDLAAKPKPRPDRAPAGAIRADEIVVKDNALQFSKVAGRSRPNALFDDLGQRPLTHQLLMGLVIVGVSIGCLLLGLMLAGVIGGD